MEISPYAVFRRSRVTMDDLAPISFSDAWAGIDETRSLECELGRMTGRITDGLERIIGTVPQEGRRPLVELRRDVHNRRAGKVRASRTRLPEGVDDGTLALIGPWLDLQERVEAAGRRAELAFSENAASAAEHLATLFAHDAMERSLQLSGAQLYQDLRRHFRAGAARVKPAKRRMRESSIVNFAYRAAFKPSPFARFTEVGAFDPSAPDRSRPPRAPGSPASTATLNRLLVNWVLAALPLVPGGLRAGNLVLSSALRERDGIVDYIGVAPGGWKPGRLAEETVIRFAADRATLELVDLLSDGPVPGDLVIERLAGAMGDEDAVLALILGLIRLGVLFYRPDADDHDPRYARRVLGMLPADGDGRLAAIRQEFSRLVGLEEGFSATEAEGRDGLLREADEAVAGIAAAAGAAPPPPDVLKSPVFEDMPAASPPRAWDGGLLERSRAGLRGLWDLACVLDNGQIRRLGLYSFAVDALGGRESLPFIDFFRIYSDLDERERTEVQTGSASPDAAAFIEQRAAAMEKMRRAVVIGEGRADLDPGAIEAAASGVDGLLRTESITFRIQFAGAGAAPRARHVVVNGVLTGYGVYMSRFGTYARPIGDWTLESALREHLASRFPGQVDLNSVLGFNFNLHPPVTRAVVEYPGAVSRSAGQRVLSPARLHVRPDHAEKAVRLWDPDERAYVDLVPMNFMTPYGVPLLYRLLEQMTPSNRYHWNPLEDVLGEDALRGGRPRLMVGGVVADRRSWAFEAGAVPELELLSRDDVKALVRFDEWRIGMGLPQEVFAQCQTRAEADVLAGRGGHESRQWSDFAHIRRASVHKPMYVDLRNPYLVRNLARSALSRPDVVVTMRECLPASTDYSSSYGSTSAEEYFVEFFAPAAERVR